MAEMRAQEAETKLHYSSQRSLRLEDKCYRLEKECNSIHHNYCNLEKHLQKQAVLHQMQISPIVSNIINNIDTACTKTASKFMYVQWFAMNLDSKE